MKNQLTPSQVYQLGKLDQICLPKSIKERGEKKCPDFHVAQSQAGGAKPEGEPDQVSLPCSLCWRASGKLAQSEHQRQLGSVRLQATADKPCQMKLSTAEPCGTISAYQAGPSAKNGMTRTPLAP